MEATKTTSKKKNAAKIRNVLTQKILKSTLKYYYANTDPGQETIAVYSRFSDHVANEILHDPVFEIILKRG